MFCLSSRNVFRLSKLRDCCCIQLVSKVKWDTRAELLASITDTPQMNSSFFSTSKFGILNVPLQLDAKRRCVTTNINSPKTGRQVLAHCFTEEQSGSAVRTFHHPVTWSGDFDIIFTLILLPRLSWWVTLVIIREKKYPLVYILVAINGWEIFILSPVKPSRNASQLCRKPCTKGSQVAMIRGKTPRSGVLASE